MHNLNTWQMNTGGQQDKQTDTATDSARTFTFNAVYAMLLVADVQLLALLLLLLLDHIDQLASPATLTDFSVSFAHPRHVASINLGWAAEILGGVHGV